MRNLKQLKRTSDSASHVFASMYKYAFPFVSIFLVSDYAFLKITAGPSIPPAVSYTKRPQANSVESEQKEEWDKDVARKLGSTTVGSKSEMTASPLVGPERKKSSTIPSVSNYSDILQYAVVICC